MDIEVLEFRAACLQAVRIFFISKNYLELDTPVLASALIPESCLEVFRTEYKQPFSQNGETMPLFLTPSPEVFIKPVIAQHGRSVFQLSKCYRNGESVGSIHSPEFTMLEYYTMNDDYKASIALTEEFFRFVAARIEMLPVADHDICSVLTKPFLRLTMDEAFQRYAGFSLATAHTVEILAHHAQRVGLGEYTQYVRWNWDDLYELLLVHCVEPNLPHGVPVALMDYPAQVPCLAAENSEMRIADDGTHVEWRTKQRWEVYVNGVELANCYTEERSADKIERYFAQESEEKKKHALVPHASVSDFGKVCAKMPPCSGVALGFDRLLMLLTGKRTLTPLLHSGF